MADDNQVRVDLFDEYSSWDMPAVELVAKLQRLIAEQPVEYREIIKFEVEVDDDYYGGSTTKTQMYYWRPETAEEAAAREAAHARYMEQARIANEGRERAILAQLKAKYGE